MADKSAIARTVPAGMMPNRPSPEGRELGAHLARLADAAEADAKERFPNHSERCKTCAFRGGTIPNGCAATLMDALKSVIEFREFMCHEKPAGDEPTKICAGWFLAMSALGPDAKPGEAPWPYSCEPDDAEPADESYCAELEAKGLA